MAHQLWPIKHTKKTSKELLHFLRMDMEVGKGQQLNQNIAQEDVKDWGTLFNYFEIFFVKLIAKSHKVRKITGIFFPATAIWYRYTEYLLHKTIDLFSSYKVIRTSRLHGHILSCLMDKPNILVDNSYGKNFNYYKTWTYRCDPNCLEESSIS